MKGYFEISKCIYTLSLITLDSKKNIIEWDRILLYKFENKHYSVVNKNYNNKRLINLNDSVLILLH